MVSREEFDNGRDIDWGKTSEDYAQYRPGPPPSLYNILKEHGIGLPGQRILDQGTGTGVFGRQLAKQGCHVVGTDLSENQITFAKELAKKDGLENIEFLVSPAEVNPFNDHSFDIMIFPHSCAHQYYNSDFVDFLLNYDNKAIRD